MTTVRAPAIVATLMLLISCAIAQEASDSVLVSEGDSLELAFDPLSVHLPGMGQIGPTADSTESVSAEDLQWVDGIALPQVFRRSGPLFVWDLGEPGQNSQLLFHALDWRSISLSLDGIPLNDPIGGGFNLYDVPIEFVNRLEIVPAAIGPSTPTPAPAGMLNIISPQYITYRPVTKIRFLQGPYGEVFTDGLYTQNVSRSTNLVIGFQRHATDGRYTNASYDAWNLRTRLRFDLTNRLNVGLTYLYTKRVNGTNGGVFIDSTRSIFQGPAATVRFPQATETLWRHDVALQILTALFADTTARTAVTLTYTLHERDYRDMQSPVYSNPALDRTHVAGLRLMQNIPLGFLDATVGGELQRMDVTASRHVGLRNETRGGVWGRASTKLFGILEPRVHVREDFFEDERLPSAGAGLTLHAGTWWEFLIDAASVRRIPTLQERFWTSPLVTRLSDVRAERHRIFEATLIARPWESASLALTGFDRTIDDGVLFVATSPAATRSTGVAIVSVSRLSIQGATLEATLPVWKFGLQLTGSFLEYTEGDTIKTLLPKWSGTAEVYYRDQLFNDNLDLKLGIRVQGMSRHRGMEYVPSLPAYVENRGEEVGRFASMDLYGIFHIGDAFVTLAWENFLDVNYYITPVHPMPDRNITLGINWRFLD